MERQTWDEICAMYPDQYVCLVDVEEGKLGDGHHVRSAHVVGHRPTFHAANALTAVHGALYPLTSVAYTGMCPYFLHRPHVVLDDATLEILNEPLRFVRRP